MLPGRRLRNSSRLEGTQASLGAITGSEARPVDSFVIVTREICFLIRTFMTGLSLLAPSIRRPKCLTIIKEFIVKEVIGMGRS